MKKQFRLTPVWVPLLRLTQP